MKTRINVRTAFLQVLALVIMCSVTFPAHAVDAVITDQKGVKSSVSGLRAHRTDNCKGFTYYLGTATETDTDFDSIFLAVDDGQYQLQIPLDIIKSVTPRQTDTKNTSSRMSEQWSVLLSDGTTLLGKPIIFLDFKGQTELGDFTIPLANVAQLSFPSPKTSHHAKANGNRSVTLYATETDQMSLTGANFIYEDKNRNGCFEGFEYKDNIEFVTEGGTKYQVTWDKIHELRFATHSASIQLVAPSGTEYTGQVNALGVEGVKRIGAFDLHIVVPFASTAKKLTVDKK